MRFLRSLWRQPGYLLLSVMTLTLAVGVNLVVFTIVNAIWLRPRPVRDPARVVMVLGDTSSFGSSENFAFAELGLQTEVRDVTDAFESVAGQVTTSGVNAGLTPKITLDAVGHPVETLGVTSEYFGVLGVPIRGRDFRRADDRFGAPPVVIISDRLWRRTFGAPPDVIGRVLPASPMPLQIIGIAPAGFSGARLGEQADLWIPRNLVPFVAPAIPRASDGSLGMREDEISIQAIARLRRGITPATAEQLLGQQSKSPSRLAVVPLSEIFGSPDHRTLIINEGRVLRLIGAAAALVLLGGCATLMALVFVHYERRRSEFGIHLALGASAARLSFRLAAELIVLAVAGTVCAGLAANWGLHALPAVNVPTSIDLNRLDLHFDWRVVLAGITATAFTMIVAAALPMRRFTASGIAASLVSLMATSPLSSLRVRQLMLAAQVAATIVVIAAAGLFVRTVENGINQRAGFDAAHMVAVDVELTYPRLAISADEAKEMRGLRSPEERVQRIQQLTAKSLNLRRPAKQHIWDAINGLPGVQSAALGVPPIGPDSAYPFSRVRTIEEESGIHLLRAGFATVDPEYLKVLDLRIIAGRALAPSDASRVLPDGSFDLSHTADVVISASLAGTLWPGQSPLGRHFKWGSDYQVVGVVGDFAFGSVRFDPPYVILRAGSFETLTSNHNVQIVLRTADPDSLVQPVKRAIAAAAPDAPKVTVMTGREMLAADLGRERLGAWFFTGFGMVATCLGIAGVFGIVAYLAESRRREFGIRAAIGATTAQLTRLVMSAGLIPVAIGISVGLIGALWLGKAAESFLIGIHWFDPISYLTAAALILVCAAAAGLMAGWRVKRIAPSEALRAE